VASLRRTPLRDRHAEAGARLAAFAGFEMPILYGSIVAEHRAVRSRAGLFDVSHMGELRLRGRDASALAQRAFSNDVAATQPGRVRYGVLCLEDGGVLDDVTLYRCSEDDLFLCVNAANTRADFEWLGTLREREGFACELIDESDETGLLAVQGPEAVALVERLLPAGTPLPRRWRFAEAELAGVRVRLSRTGYTGEDGFEIYTSTDRVGLLWDRLREAGGERLALAGLGARDTLRTEMGYPLYGHELDREHDPIEAGLARFLAFGRGFIGEAALERARAEGPERRLVGLVLEARPVARPGTPICAQEPIGTVTSGTFGPSVERSIAIGYVPARYADPGTRLSVEVRGRHLPCRVTPTPFFVRKG
jgi:aminomethyltransferase